MTTPDPNQPGDQPHPPGSYPPPAPGSYQQQGYPQQGYPQPGYPPQPGYGMSPYGPGVSDKSKMAAGLLQIFLGGFGVGRFYLGYTGIGVAQLVVTLVTCGAGSIWGLIDGIMMLTGSVPDAQGRPLRD